jgi:hypothetical protein
MNAQTRINEGSALIQAFQDRVDAYVRQAKAAQKDLPAPKTAAKKGEILEQQHLAAERVRSFRPDAKQGDICTPEVAGEMRRLIGLAMQGSNAARVRKSLMSGEPMRLALKVHAPFPDKLPLQSTPATLLLNLPRLPAELDYRFVGRALVLRDTTANIIVDFIPDALPAHK